MKLPLPFLLTLGLLAFGGDLVHGQILIDWSAITPLSSDSDINTQYQLFDAVNTTEQGGTYTTTTVGTTTFNALTNLAGGTAGVDGTDGYITIHADGGNYSGFGFSGGTAAYKAILDTASDASAGVITIGSSLHPLVSGDTYQVQLLAYYPGPYAAKVDGVTPVSFPNYSGGSIIGTFVANAPTETIDYGGIDDNAGHNGFINDVIVEVVPEPGTWAMLFGGLGVLALVSRFRRVLQS